MLDKKKNNAYLAEKLRATQRAGIEQVLDKLYHDYNFSEAPASSGFHLNEPGGLVQHSVSVYDTAMRLRDVVLERKPELADRLTPDSIAIAALLHDICKTDVYKPAIKRRKNAKGIWEDYNGYDVDYHNFPMGHGEKSVIMLLRMGLELTDDEMLAIRWHMSAWDLPFQSAEAKSSLNAAKDNCPLLSLIQAADSLSAGILEG